MPDYNAVISFGKGCVDCIYGQEGPFISIERMRQILEYATEYLERHGDDDTIEDKKIEYWKQREFEYEERQRKEKEEKAAKKSMEKLGESCYIYLISDPIRGLYKIGKANNFPDRFKQLRTANAGIEAVAHYKGVSSDERVIHSVLDGLNKRVSGEWFSLNDADIEYFHLYFKKQPLPF